MRRRPEVESLADLRPRRAAVLLFLPPTVGHEARTAKARGVWTVSCSCGGHVARTRDPEDAMDAWARHRLP